LHTLSTKSGQRSCRFSTKSWKEPLPKLLKRKSQRRRSESNFNLSQKEANFFLQALLGFSKLAERILDLAGALDLFFLTGAELHHADLVP